MKVKLFHSIVLACLISWVGQNAQAEPELPKSVGESSNPSENQDAGEGPVYYEIKKEGHNETAVPEGVSGFKKFLGRTTVGGYFDVEFDNDGGVNNASSFDAHRFVLGVSSQLNNWLSINSEIELEHGGDGTITNGDHVALEQAFFDATVRDWLTFRGGVVLIPMGRVNILHDANLLDFTTRPLPDLLIIPSTWSETGVGVHGFHNFANNMAFNYELYVTNGLASPNGDGNVLGNGGNRGLRNGFRSDNNNDKAISGRLGFSPMTGLELGASAYTTDLASNGAGDERMTILGGDLRYQSPSWEFGNTIVGPVELEGEVYKTFVDTNGVTGQFGYYAQLNFHWFPGPFRKVIPDGTFTNMVRFNYVDTNTAGASTDERKRLEIGMNFRPIEPFVIKAEYQMNFGSETAANNNDRIIASAAIAF